MKDAEGKLIRYREEESCIYMDYRAGSISQSEYVEYKMNQEDRLAELRKIEDGKK